MTRRPFLHLSLSLVLAAAGSSLVPACGQQCDRNPDEPPVPWKDGITDQKTETYYSAKIDGPYLDFPPGRTYRFFHGLHGVPQNVSATTSFAEYPADGKDNEGFVQPAGNQVTFEHVTDTYVDVRNDTCSDVRIRLVASAPLATSTDAGATSDAAP